MMSEKILKVGIIGTVVAALCCFTPILVWIFIAVGFSGAVGYLDFILFPALLVFICITGYALWKRRQKK